MPDVDGDQVLLGGTHLDLRRMACELREQDIGMLDASAREVRLRWQQLLHAPPALP